jgi:hypothetical protein
MAVSGNYLPDMLMRNNPSGGFPLQPRQPNIELMYMLIHHTRKKKVILVNIDRFSGMLDYLQEERGSQVFSRAAQKSVGAFDIPLTNPFEALSQPTVTKKWRPASSVNPSPSQSSQGTHPDSTLAESSSITYPDVTTDTLNFFPFDSEPGDLPLPSRRHMPGVLLAASAFPGFDDVRVQAAIEGVASETKSAVIRGSFPYVAGPRASGEPEEDDDDEGEEEEDPTGHGSEPSAGGNSQRTGASRSQQSSSQGSTESRGSARYRNNLRRPGGQQKRQPISFVSPSPSPERVLTYTDLCAGMKANSLSRLEAKRQHFVSDRNQGQHFREIFPCVVWKHDKRHRMLKKRRLRGYVKVSDLFQADDDILDGFTPSDTQLLLQIHLDAYLWVGVCEKVNRAGCLLADEKEPRMWVMLPPMRRDTAATSDPQGVGAVDPGVRTMNTWYSAHGEADEFLRANPDGTCLTNMLLVVDQLRERMTKRQAQEDAPGPNRRKRTGSKKSSAPVSRARERAGKKRKKDNRPWWKHTPVARPSKPCPTGPTTRSASSSSSWPIGPRASR